MLYSYAFFFNIYEGRFGRKAHNHVTHCTKNERTSCVMFPHRLIIYKRNSIAKVSSIPLKLCLVQQRLKCL